MSKEDNNYKNIFWKCFVAFIPLYVLYFWKYLPDFGAYVGAVGLSFILDSVAWFNWFFVNWFFSIIIGHFNFEPMSQFFLASGFLLINLVSSIVFVSSRVCFWLLNLLVEVVRILLSVSGRPISYYELMDSKGFELNSIFLFHPLVTHDMAEGGLWAFAPMSAEVLFFQRLSLVFQCAWGSGFFLYWSISFVLGSFGDMLFVLYFLVFASISACYRWLVWDHVVLSGVVCAFFILCLWFRYGNKLLNFLNLQTIFSIVVPNRWFGLNLAPGSSVGAILVNFFEVRMRYIGSVFWRLESLVLFTTHLRLDPKLIDIRYW
jgi:hypothetical protein